MATLLPFKGLRYSNVLAGELSRLITPPYDIISPSDQERFYRVHPKNIIRLELGKTRETDTPKNNRYTRAHDTLQKWLTEDVLQFENKPAFYLLQTEYNDPNGETKLFTGIFARVKLEALGEGKILPHEQTYEGPKTDRYNLLKETNVSFSPVFALYRDPSRKINVILNKIMKIKPPFGFKDWSGCQHRMWVIQHPATVMALQQYFKGKKLLIADGHHRYMTAIRYQKEACQQAGSDADSVMMCVAETHDPGVTVLPVYRLVQDVNAVQWKYFREHLEVHFDVEKISQVAQLQNAQQAATLALKRPVIGYLESKGKSAYLLKVKSENLERLYNPQVTHHSRIYHRLDVVILNQMILDSLLGIRPGEEKGRITYTKNFQEAKQVVARGEVQAAFLPGLPNLEAIWDLAKQGETMPQKSTYFLPKIITGLVMNPIGLKVS